MRRVVLLMVALAQLILADFTPHFRKFLHDNYGVSMVSSLERTDLGMDSSFGGMRTDADTPKRQAVILVHGITNKITRFMPMVHFLHSQGYTNSEVYGTTWGDAGVTPIGLVDMKCSYYTGTQVDVVAYSMGAPIARKAILGGQCVDTREILGPPLTEIIDTFVSVAGANHGTALCVVPIPIGTCNRRTGLHCDSVFLQDINNQAKYEATYIFSIFSTGDEKIGFRACGKPVSPIKGGTGYVKKDGLSHDELMDSTYHLQMNFFTKHAPK
ncbi:unnamed protein product [Nippostrongylus brasiliensis]|uniref:Triacylglycerol lipase n=1 Tax=Nippostrongylus brasiliensis TaxID=27835 RepID=A0A0N4XT47_NIPBR|nr:unnamed protein product [Nippostrongylus brasiliensis]